MASVPTPRQTKRTAVLVENPAVQGLVKMALAHALLGRCSATMVDAQISLAILRTVVGVGRNVQKVRRARAVSVLVPKESRSATVSVRIPNQTRTIVEPVESLAVLVLAKTGLVLAPQGRCSATTADARISPVTLRTVVPVGRAVEKEESAPVDSALALLVR